MSLCVSRLREPRRSPSQGEEGVFHTLVRLGTRLEEAQSKLVGKRLALLESDGALLVPIALVANEDLVDPGRRVLVDLGVPGANVWFWLALPA